MFNKASGYSISSPTVKKLYETSDETIFRLKSENSQLQRELSLERHLRYDAEHKVEELEKQIELLQTIPKRKRRTKAEIEAEEGQLKYSKYKSNGMPKAQKAEPIRSYKDFALIQNYFIENGKIRDWALWTVGVSLGLRVSDLLNLKFGDLIDEHKNFYERIYLIEKKTSKAHNCLITEAVRVTLEKYFDFLNWQFSLDDYLFQSEKTKSKMSEEHGWRILSNAGKALNIPVNIGSHTMRKTFANIAACVDKSSIDMNAIAKIQGLLNHSDQRVTMKYLDTYQLMFDKARMAVSDFVLGNTDVDELIAGNTKTIEDILVVLERIDNKLQKEM